MAASSHHHHHHVPVSVSEFDNAASALLPTTVTSNSSSAFMLNNNVLSSYTGYTSYTPVEYTLPPIDGRGPPDFTDLGSAAGGAPWPPCWGPADPYQAAHPPPPSSGFASQVEAELALGKIFFLTLLIYVFVRFFTSERCCKITFQSCC